MTTRKGDGRGAQRSTREDYGSAEQVRRTYEPPRIEEIGTVLSLTRMPRKGSRGFTDSGSISK